MSSSLFLIVWDTIRLSLNYQLPRKEVNCFGVSKNAPINSTLWFLARFCGSQLEMHVLIITFWKKYRRSIETDNSRKRGSSQFSNILDE